jgi:glycosyltransferase involved in cell wall biosynthesis
MIEYICKPKVSICIVTYNQVEYIGQCIQSVLDQVTNFDFEILVGDDASTDGTTEVVKNFAKLHPGKITSIFHEKNVGAQTNYFSVHNIARGQYIAHIDGDDYCLPGKLQIQADVLDSVKSCNLVFHRMLVIGPNGEQVKPISASQNSDMYEIEFFDRSSIIQYISIACHSSKMYRSSVRTFTQVDFEILDYFLDVEHVGAGFACVLTNGFYGVYRAGIGMSTSSKTKVLLGNCFLCISKKYPEYRPQLNTAVLQNLLMDLKNFRSTWILFFKIWLKTYHIQSIFILWRSRKRLKNLY